MHSSDLAGLPVAITRCGNLYGGGDLNFNRLVPGTVRSLLAGERPVLRSDGSPQRDYIYVEDAAAAYVQLAERTHEDGVAGEATAKAIRNFEEFYNYKETGQATPQLLQLLLQKGATI